MPGIEGGEAKGRRVETDEGAIVSIWRRLGGGDFLLSIAVEWLGAPSVAATRGATYVATQQSVAPF